MKYPRRAINGDELILFLSSRLVACGSFHLTGFRGQVSNAVRYPPGHAVSRPWRLFFNPIYTALRRPTATTGMRSSNQRWDGVPGVPFRISRGISPRRASAPALVLQPSMKDGMDGTAPGCDPAAPVARRALWLARLWDWIFVLVVLVGGTIVLETLFEPRVHEIRINDPALSFKKLPELVPSYALGILVMLASIATFCVFEFPLLRHSGWLTLFSAYYLGFMESCGFTLFFTNIVKLIVGRPRPFFKEVCVDFVSGFNCKGDPGEVAGARKSFPSGHSSLSFACFVYLTLYMAHKIRITHPRTACRSIKLGALSLPLLAAGLVAISRLVDNHHFYADVLAGSVLGTLIAFAVWNARWRDIEMTRTGILTREEVLPMNGSFPSVSLGADDEA